MFSNYKDYSYMYEIVYNQLDTNILYFLIRSITYQDNSFLRTITFDSDNNLVDIYSIPKYSYTTNLHKSNVILPLYNSNITLSKSPLYKELMLQQKLLIYNNLLLKNLQEVSLFQRSQNTLAIINAIFEGKSYDEYESYLVSPEPNVLYYMNYNKFDTQIIFKTLLTHRILILNKTDVTNLMVLKTTNTILKGGDIVVNGLFSPLLIATNLYNSLVNLMTMYQASKTTSVIMYNIVIESLMKQYKSQGIILSSYLFEIIVKKMVSFVRVIDSGNTSLMVSDVFLLSLINLINQSYYKHNLCGAVYTPVILGITKLSIGQSGFLSSISFQELLKYLSKLVLMTKVDWLENIKSKLITSDLINTGTGWLQYFVKR